MEELAEKYRLKLTYITKDFVRVWGVILIGTPD